MSWPRWSLHEVLAGRPKVRVNQLGYLPDRPKHATLVTTDAQPVDAVVRDLTGVAVWHGRSRCWPQRPEPSSGLLVHLVDLSAPRVPG